MCTLRYRSWQPQYLHTLARTSCDVQRSCIALLFPRIEAVLSLYQAPFSAEVSALPSTIEWGRCIVDGSEVVHLATQGNRPALEWLSRCNCLHKSHTSLIRANLTAYDSNIGTCCIKIIVSGIYRFPAHHMMARYSHTYQLAVVKHDRTNLPSCR